MLSVLEGGYDCKVGGGLQSSTEQHLRALSRAPRTSSVGTNNKRGPSSLPALPHRDDEEDDEDWQAAANATVGAKRRAR